MSRIALLKTKSPKKASWPGFLASGKDSRTKVVLARKLEKQGLGSTPELSPEKLVDHLHAEEGEYQVQHSPEHYHR